MRSRFLVDMRESRARGRLNLTMEWGVGRKTGSRGDTKRGQEGKEGIGGGGGDTKRARGQNGWVIQKTEKRNPWAGEV